MMNTVALHGRLTAAPEIRHTPNDIAVVSFSLAVNSGYGDKQKASFVDCVAWRSTAEFVTRYFTKGRMAVIDGRLQLRDWTDRDGNKRRSAEIVANSVNFGDSKPQDQAAPASGYAPAGAPAGGGSSYAVLEDDGDLPF